MRTIKECKLMMASENWKDDLKLRTQSHEILPELIRVIELVEDVLDLYANKSAYEDHITIGGNRGCPVLRVGCEPALQALSEIRKLKGE